MWLNLDSVKFLDIRLISVVPLARALPHSKEAASLRVKERCVFPSSYIGSS